MSTEFEVFSPAGSTDSPVGQERPTYQDLQDNAEAGVVKRALTRYLVPRNYESSIRRHERLGSPLVRKVVMGTVGRGVDPGSGGNYRLDHNRTPIEAATHFAFRESVFNEAVHTVAAAPATAVVAASIAESTYDYATLANGILAGANLALVALQRYNRARMVKRIDEQLQAGATYDKEYTNWTGIDARASDNYYGDSQDDSQAIDRDDRAESALPYIGLDVNTN